MNLIAQQNVTQLTLNASQNVNNVILNVTQKVTPLKLNVSQNETVVELQPIIYKDWNDTFVETDPIFNASEAALFIEGDKANLDYVVEQIDNKLDKPTTPPVNHDHVVVINSNNNTSKIPLSDITGAIDTILVNGEELEIINKTVDIETITKHSELDLDDGTNPHGTTKTDVGLDNVDNTSDLDKPISTATQDALDIKLDKNTSVTADTMMYVKNPDGTQDIIPIYNKPRVFSHNFLFSITNTSTQSFKGISLAGSSNTYTSDTSTTIAEELISKSMFKWQLSVPFNCKLTRVSMSINSGQNNEIALIKGNNISPSFSNRVLLYKQNSGGIQPIDDRNPINLINIDKHDFIGIYIMTQQLTGTNYGFINLEFEEV